MEGWEAILFFALIVIGAQIPRYIELRRKTFITRYIFPDSILIKLRDRYPHLDGRQLRLVEEGLRQYFLVCLRTGRNMASMPSQVVDEAWHNFILITREYDAFCQAAFGRFLHHVPSEAMEDQTTAQLGIKRTWKLSCLQEEIDHYCPFRLPLLFSIDTQLKIEDGFHYALNCIASGSQCYCAGHIGCAAAGSENGCGSDCGGGGCGGD